MIDLPKLRPVELRDLPKLFQWLNSKEALGNFDECSFPSLLQLEKKFASGDYQTTWIIDLDGKEIGYANFAIHPWDNWIACIGVIIAEPSFRGKGYGTIVHLLLTNLIFERFPNISKLEAFTDIENLPEKRALEKSGFDLEGTQKRKNKLRGQYRDMHVFGFLRPDETASIAAEL